MNRSRKINCALKHLRKSDPVINKLIGIVGPYTLRIERDRFAVLARSIISQQISTAAARSIRRRLEQLLGPSGLSPKPLLTVDKRQLRLVGLSERKVEYLKGLAKKAVEGSIELNVIGRLSDRRVIEELCKVKGIGTWTAQMFLIFSLGRLDVFPDQDGGIRRAIKQLYALPLLPDTQTCLEIAKVWRPFASVASWYCWRSLDINRKVQDRSNGYPV